MEHPLKTLRENKGLTQSECGKRVGLAGSVISQIECGSYKPSKKQLEKIAMAFKLDVVEFVQNVTEYYHVEQHKHPIST